ncbi:MAG: hypothetical protein RIS41_1382 [Actinomycetota bacterium]|jgi:hypothetical protein
MKTLSRTTVIERLERNNEVALKALEKGVTTVRTASSLAKATIATRLPKVDLPTLPVPAVVETAIEKNVEFAKSVLHTQAEFVTKAVRTVAGKPVVASKAKKARKKAAPKATAAQEAASA